MIFFLRKQADEQQKKVTAPSCRDVATPRRTG